MISVMTFLIHTSQFCSMEKIIVTTANELEALIQNSVRKAINEQPEREQDRSSQTFSISEAANYVNLSPQTLYGFTSKRKIPFIKKGKKLYFKKDDLDKWLETGRKKSKDEIQDELNQK